MPTTTIFCANGDVTSASRSRRRIRLFSLRNVTIDDAEKLKRTNQYVTSGTPWPAHELGY